MRTAALRRLTQLLCAGAMLALTVLAAADTAERSQSQSLQSSRELAQEARASIRELPAAELSARLQKNPELLLVDVRTEREYLAGHLSGADWIPRGKLEFVIANKDLPADHEIVLYCRTGARAALAAKALQDMGYRNVSSLEGGFKQWAVDGNSIYNQHGEIRVLEFEAVEE